MTIFKLNQLLFLGLVICFTEEGAIFCIPYAFSFKVKGVNMFGPRSEYIVSGSDCGHVFLWDRETEAVVNFLVGDEAGVVCCPICSLLILNYIYLISIIGATR